MNKLISFCKSLILVAFAVLLLLLAIPSIKLNIGDSQVSFSLADDLLRSKNLSISDFRKGDGLYPTSLVRAKFPEDATDDQINTIYKTISNRVLSAQMNDIKLSIISEEDQKYLTFEYPEYYSNTVEYTQWLTAPADITFTTAGESPQVLDLQDYDIVGSIQTEFSQQYGDMLILNFDASKSSLLASQFPSQGQAFLMYIDTIPSFYIVDFDNFPETNVNKVKAISGLGLTGGNFATVTNYVNIVRSYFLTAKLPLSLSVDSSSSIIPAKSKPASLSIIAAAVIALSLIPIVVWGLLKKYSLRKIIDNLILMSIYSLFCIAALKYIGAVLNSSLLISYCAALILAQIYILNIGSIKYPRRYLLAFLLMVSAFTKLTMINYELGIISGSLALGSLSLLVTSYYYDLVTNFKLPKISKKFLSKHKYEISK